MYLWQNAGIGHDESSVIPDMKVSLVQSQILVAQVQLTIPIRLRYLQAENDRNFIETVYEKKREKLKI
jgi:hypothetical protein